jgi:hypothetical protein
MNESRRFENDSDDSRRSTIVNDHDKPDPEGPRGPDDKIESEERSAPACPRRVIPLRDLAGRANVCNQATITNQELASQQLVPLEEKRIPALMAAAQLIASALFHCTLAICERLDDRDAPGLIEEIDQNLKEQNGRLN